MNNLPEIQIEEKDGYFCGSFRCMASPCTIFIDNSTRATALTLTRIAAREASRIERKFSRFRNDNIIHRINQSNGMRTEVDSETGLLLDFAENCYEMSDGRFDITSGILRRIWHFDGSDNIPEKHHVDALLPLIGWDKTDWDNPYLRLPPGMEVDLGGIGKEYAVDKTLLLLKEHTDNSVLVNFGGDLNASGPRNGNQPWRVGLEKPKSCDSAGTYIDLSKGALTTSGDSQRFLKKNGIIYSHILDPATGWPVANPPRSVSVAAPNCTEAGILSTLAMLHGSDAEDFLKAQGVRYWCQR